jgi:hypothetical protein
MGKRLGDIHAWRTPYNSHRDIRRPPLHQHKRKPGKTTKIAYNCIGGPFDKQRVWLSQCVVKDVAVTTVFKLKQWYGHYVYVGNRTITWQPDFRWQKEDRNDVQLCATT